MHETTTEIKISETYSGKGPDPSQKHKNIQECDFLTERAELVPKCQNFPKDLVYHVGPKLFVPQMRWSCTLDYFKEDKKW